MKITHDDAIRDVAARKITTDQTKQAGSFDAILNKVIEENKASQRMPIPHTSAISGPSFIDTASLLSVDKPRIVNGAERLLNMLEEFQMKLADAHVPLSDISPIMERINQEKDLLLPFLDSLPEADPLRDVLNRTLITCSVEMGKFERGDYL
ncbi:MAG: hypothetical protein C0392_04550 [Syntrophus sp. (in: bacteria)]|nr:hypothetical protein [Syntrophus sp. (in: bacteria)]